MGVRVFDEETGAEGAACHACGASAATASSSSYASSQQTKNSKGTFVHESKTTTEVLGEATNRAAKDLVGNCKEFRIENNKGGLRVIGNGNRIRIGVNTGTVHVIGNSSRLKIRENSAQIKYTGNDGRICLSSDSAQQTVEYIGCNGILKIVDAAEFTLATSKRSQRRPNTQERAPSTATKATTLGEQAQREGAPEGKVPRVARMKSASYGGYNWREYLDALQSGHWRKFANASMPNLKENHSNPKAEKSCCCCCCKKTTCQDRVNGGGRHGAANAPNIVITNSVNIKI